MSRLRPPPRSTLFPYTTLFRSADSARRLRYRPYHAKRSALQNSATTRAALVLLPAESRRQHGRTADRKSTRLNSSHLGISYAVFCLKKKKKKKYTTQQSNYIQR